jgi:hypothetical protein
MSVQGPNRKFLDENGWYALAILLIVGYCLLVYQLEHLGILSKGAFASNMTTFVGWLLALVTAGIHLSKTRESQRLARLDEARQALERVAFQEINAATSAFSSTLTTISTPYRVVPRMLGVYPAELARRQLSDFLATSIFLHSAQLYEAAAKFTLAIESNEIAVIPFHHLRVFIQQQVDDFQRTLSRFWNFANSRPLETYFSPDKKAELTKQADIVLEEADRIICYLFDYRIELMNSLLASAFANRVPRRKPLDARYARLTDVATVEVVERAEEERLRAALSGANPGEP